MSIHNLLAIRFVDTVFENLLGMQWLFHDSTVLCVAMDTACYVLQWILLSLLPMKHSLIVVHVDFITCFHIHQNTFHRVVCSSVYFNAKAFNRKILKITDWYGETSMRYSNLHVNACRVVRHYILKNKAHIPCLCLLFYCNARTANLKAVVGF